MPGPSSLGPPAAELQIERLVVEDAVITVVARAHRAAVACPACAYLSSRVHSRYVRTLADLPWEGVRVRLQAHVRKFFCDTPACRRQIFTEPLPETAARYARRTARAVAALEVLGFALGGRAGARVAQALGLGGAPGTILERVRRAVEGTRVTPRVLGVDDWAMRRGLRYGTLLVDLERHRVVDLLPDREATTLAAWLAAHPGVEIISRDRGGAYAEGARQGAPNAIQVADRFHLVRNLVDALERACTRHHAALRAAAEATRPPPQPRDAVRKRRYSGLPNNRPGPTVAERKIAERRARRHARYEQVVALRAAGQSKLAIARATGLDRRTVDTWLAAGQFPERAPRPRAPHRLDRYAAYIVQRYDAGLDNAAQLARELAERGYRGAANTVRRYLAALRATRPRGASMMAPASPVSPALIGTAPPSGRVAVVPVPSPRRTAWLLRHAEVAPERLTDAERAFVTTLCERCPDLADARELAGAFTRMLTARDANPLAPWLAAAHRSELRAFATGLERDRDAVLAAVCFPWSNGQVEGQVHRLKLVKHAMYGRATFALLRKRFLRAA